jgi:CDP-diacylglycerol pyrophosphatase
MTLGPEAHICTAQNKQCEEKISSKYKHLAVHIRGHLFQSNRMENPNIKTRQGHSNASKPPLLPARG